MKKIGTSLLFLSALLITACSSNGGHAGSRFNLISSLFENANKSSISSNEEPSSVPTESSFGGSDVSSEIVATSSIDYPKYDNIDIDLTTMNATMVYSEVNNMLSTPSSYVGKIVKMEGPFIPFDSTNPDYCYPAIVIRDATACCASGIEFLLYGVPRCSKTGGNGYPLYNEEATIVGRFETYLEGTYMYVHLVDAIWLEGMNQ